jgi:hypothetical protein
VWRSEVEKNVFCVFFVVEKLMNFLNVLPNFSYVERSEILEESFVDKILYEGVDTSSMLKKKALGTSLGGLVSAM